MLSTIIPKTAEEEFAKMRADLFNCKVMRYLENNMFYRMPEEKKALLLEREQIIVYLATKKLSFKAEDILLPVEEQREVLAIPKCMEAHIPSFAEIRGEV